MIYDGTAATEELNGGRLHLYRSPEVGSKWRVNSWLYLRVDRSPCGLPLAIQINTLDDETAARLKHDEFDTPAAAVEHVRRLLANANPTEKNAKLEVESGVSDGSMHASGCPSLLP